MRKRVGLIICLLAMFSMLTFVAISDEDTDGPVKAKATVTGSSRLYAKGRVFSPSTCWGSWAISVRAGNSQVGTSAATYYTGGVSRNREVSEYTSCASASAWVTGHNIYDDSYYASASDFKCN